MRHNSDNKHVHHHHHHLHHYKIFNMACIMLIIARTTGVQIVVMNGNSNRRVIL